MKPIQCLFQFPGQPDTWKRGRVAVLYQWSLLQGKSPLEVHWDQLYAAIKAQKQISNPERWILGIEQWPNTTPEQRQATALATCRWIAAVKAITGQECGTWARQPVRTWNWDGILDDNELAALNQKFADWPALYWSAGDFSEIAVYYAHTAASSINSVDRWVKYAEPMMQAIERHRWDNKVMVAISPISFAGSGNRLHDEPGVMDVPIRWCLERGYPVLIWAASSQTGNIPWNESDRWLRELKVFDDMGLVDRGQ